MHNSNSLSNFAQGTLIVSKLIEISHFLCPITVLLFVGGTVQPVKNGHSQKTEKMVFCEFVTFPFVSWVRCGT